MQKLNQRHRWDKPFIHNNTHWQKCKKCGLYKIYLCSEAHYSIDGNIINCTSVYHPCIKIK